jgi:hypothetical protein
MLAGIVAMTLLASMAASGAARAQDRIHLRTNEAEIGEVLRDGGVAIDDPLAVFGAVMRKLPDRVKVLPTENYFYFHFTNNGLVYSGNIRLAAADRDQGKIHIAYSEQPTDWNSDPKIRHAVLGVEQGVTVEKAGLFSYRLGHAGKTVAFDLNDLPGKKPPPEAIKADESFIGPVFDESGIRFFLLFNTRLKIFHFVLDETEPVADQFAPVKGAGPVVLGKRTGFAFYPLDGRKILVGVDARESRLNTDLDGPFDQLPENFIGGETLRAAIVAADPSVASKIDRLGNLATGGERYLIHPYLPYAQPGDLAVFQGCMASKAVKPADRAACLVIDDEEAQKKNPRPLALKGR